MYSFIRRDNLHNDMFEDVFAFVVERSTQALYLYAGYDAVNQYIHVRLCCINAIYQRKCTVKVTATILIGEFTKFVDINHIKLE